jgi:hypothetical protein
LIVLLQQWLNMIKMNLEKWLNLLTYQFLD